MTLAEINNQINIAQSNIDMRTAYIKGLLSSAANENIQLATAGVYSYWTNVHYRTMDAVRDLSWGVVYIHRALENLVADYYTISDETRQQINAIVNIEYRKIVDYVQSALSQIESQSGVTIDEVNAIVNSKVNEVESSLNIQMSSLQLNVDNTLAAVSNELNSNIDEVNNRVDDVESSFFDSIASTAGEIYTTVMDWVDLLWEGVESAYQWATDKVNAMYTQIYTWAVKEFDELASYVAVGFQNLSLKVANAINTTMVAITSTYNELSALINLSITTLEETVNATIESISTWLTDLSISMDWRFNFLNIALNLPELSILQVLTRPEESFEKYKPYWQALFARIIEES